MWSALPQIADIDSICEDFSVGPRTDIDRNGPLPDVSAMRIASTLILSESAADRSPGINSVFLAGSPARSRAIRGHHGACVRSARRRGGVDISHGRGPCCVSAFDIR